jgi:hypothetical protein
MKTQALICPCNHCNQPISFEREQEGTTAVCPHCGGDTQLLAPPRPYAPPPPPRLPPPPSAKKLRFCPACDAQVSLKAPACVHCGEPFDDLPKPPPPPFATVFGTVFRVWLSVVILSGILFLIVLGILVVNHQMQQSAREQERILENATRPWGK